MAEPRVIPVAVIGMACRLPGGIDSPEHLWEALLRGDDLVTEIPADRWDVEEYYDPEPGVPGRSVSRWGAFLDDVAGFDAEFFGVGERRHVDRPAASVVAGDRLGGDRARRSGPAVTGRIEDGVFTGLSHDDYTLIAAEASALEGAVRVHRQRLQHGLGEDRVLTRGTRSGRHARHGVLLGPVRSSPGLPQPADGDSDLALAGGCTVMLEPRGHSSASAQGMLSPTGRCRSFDVEADGFVALRGRAPWWCSSDCPTPYGTTTGSWRWCAARPPIRTAVPQTITCPRRMRRSRSIRRRWPRRDVDARHGRHRGGSWHRDAGR